MIGYPAALFAFAETLDPARRLAAALDLPCIEIELHRFPDGESRVRVPASAQAALLYRSLDRPNDKLVELMLAASALRDSGTARLTLVAPYLCYMRQDMAFRPGEAVSQRAVCGFLDRLFDAVVTVEPHLHRIESLSSVFDTAQATALSATALLAQTLRMDGVDPATVLVGPDGESRQWAEALAAATGLPFILGDKHRAGDRDIRIALPEAGRVQGRPALLIDDMVSTGRTLAECAALLYAAKATRVEALVVHALYGPADAAALAAAGIARIRSTDGVPHPSNAVPLAPLLAEALRGVSA